MYRIPYERPSIIVTYDETQRYSNASPSPTHAQSGGELTITHCHKDLDILAEELRTSPTVRVATEMLSILVQCEATLSHYCDPARPHLNKHIESSCRAHEGVRELATHILKSHIKKNSQNFLGKESR